VSYINLVTLEDYVKDILTWQSLSEQTSRRSSIVYCFFSVTKL